jgi:hypothetical protein
LHFPKLASMSTFCHEKVRFPRMNQILATLDPIAAMATANKDGLAALLAQIKTDSPAIQTLLANLSKQAALLQPAIVEDDVPPLPKVAVSKPGDLWLDVFLAYCAIA